MTQVYKHLTAMSSMLFLCNAKQLEKKIPELM